MKKLFAFIAVMAISAATAQTTIAAEKQDGKEPHVAGFVQNKFWDNWELQLGLGPNFTLKTGSGFRGSTNFGIYGAAVKWFHPVFGVRFTVEGGWISYRLTYPSSAQKNVNHSFIYGHPDFMINLSNWIGGYKPRVYNADLFVGFGLGSVALTSKEKRTFDYAANIGLQNRFHLGKKQAVSLDITVQYQIGKHILFPAEDVDIPAGHLQGINAYFGATYRFNKRTYDRSGMTEDEAKAMLDRISKAEKRANDAQVENGALKTAIACTNADPKASIDAAEQAIDKSLADAQAALDEAKAKVNTGMDDSQAAANGGAAKAAKQAATELADAKASVAAADVAVEKGLSNAEAALKAVKKSTGAELDTDLAPAKDKAEKGLAATDSAVADARVALVKANRAAAEATAVAEANPQDVNAKKAAKKAQKEAKKAEKALEKAAKKAAKKAGKSTSATSIQDAKAQANNGIQEAQAALDGAKAQAAQGVQAGRDHLAAAEAAEAARRAAEEAAKQRKYVQAANSKDAVDSGNCDDLNFFTYGVGSLSKTDKYRLNVIANKIKNDDSDKVYRIEGYADPNTGSKKCNEKLAAKRAKSVYDYLVKQGVSTDRLSYQGCGTENLPFNSDRENRVTVIY